jgi:hypothetical protein
LLEIIENKKLCTSDDFFEKSVYQKIMAYNYMQRHLATTLGAFTAYTRCFASAPAKKKSRRAGMRYRERVQTDLSKQVQKRLSKVSSADYFQCHRAEDNDAVYYGIRGINDKWQKKKNKSRHSVGERLFPRL